MFNYSLEKAFFLLIVFIIFTPITLAASAFALISVSSDIHKAKNKNYILANQNSNIGINIFAALPNNLPSISHQIGSSDARPEIIRNYLKKYNSPLLNYADYIVEMADKYEVDFRLTTAIAQQESNLCKVIPENTYNCWGWGIHSRGTLGFESYEEGIRVVTKGLKENYINKGLVSPEKIMQKYTPLSNGSWAYGVRLFMEDMQ